MNRKNPGGGQPRAGDRMEAFKCVIGIIWETLGQPFIWTVLMIGVFISEIINGFTVAGSFWIVFCGLMYALSRIALAIESLAKPT